jgi:hypothetical protein
LNPFLLARIVIIKLCIGEPVTETHFIRDLLLPEIETEIGKTRRLFEALPDGKSDFKPYEKSMTLGRLAGHTTDLFRLMALTLTSSELDMAVAWQPYTMPSKADCSRASRRTPVALSPLLSKSRTRPSISLGQLSAVRTFSFPGSGLPTFATKG